MTVWTPNPVSVEPGTHMQRWEIYRLYIPALGEESDHVVGYCYEGRVSSPIQEFNSKEHWVRTRSGRIYHIPEDCVGANRDAEYVFGNWVFYNKAENVRIVSNEYLPSTMDN